MKDGNKIFNLNEAPKFSDKRSSVEIGDGITQKGKKELLDKSIEFETDITKLKIYLSYAILLIGVGLTFIGFTEIIDFKINFMGISAEFIDASPGILLMVLSTIIIIKTNNEIKAK